MIGIYSKTKSDGVSTTSGDREESINGFQKKSNSLLIKVEKYIRRDEPFRSWRGKGKLNNMLQ